MSETFHHTLGPIVLEVCHRDFGPAGGPTLRVRAAADGRQLLRFDAFLSDPHWHIDPDGRDEITPMPGPPETGEPIDALLALLRDELPALLARAGVTDALPGGGVDEGTLRVLEISLRNPPAQLDGLDPTALRLRSGEKWRTYPDDVLPLWVADMDFPIAEPVRRRLQQMLQWSDLGYPVHPAPTPLPAVFAERMASRFDFSVEPRHVELLTEVVQGMYVALETLSEPGDGVLVQSPIYPPFLSSVEEMKRTLHTSALREVEGGVFAIDFGELAEKAAASKIFFFCNPHNPTGRVFRRDELERIAAIAIEHDLVVVSDEIHADLVYPGNTHVPIASLSDELAARTITLTSASKAFNIAGLRCALAAFGSAELRRRFRSFPRHLRGGLGIQGIEATVAAWRHADPWREEVVAYLEANREFALDFVKREMPGVRAFRPEATYLMWLDCAALGLDPTPYRFFLDEAKVALSNGPSFGTPGEGFLRINFATSRGILADALGRMAEALRTR